MQIGAFLSHKRHKRDPGGFLLWRRWWSGLSGRWDLAEVEAEEEQEAKDKKERRRDLQASHQHVGGGRGARREALQYEQSALAADVVQLACQLCNRHLDRPSAGADQPWRTNPDIEHQRLP